MTLTEARRYAVSKKTRIEFSTASGLDCIIDEHGIARVPELKAAPDFTMTNEFDNATTFVLVRGAQRETVSRQQLSDMAGPSKAANHAHDEDE